MELAVLAFSWYSHGFMSNYAMTSGALGSDCGRDQRHAQGHD